MGEGAGEDSICRLNGLMHIFDEVGSTGPLPWMKSRCGGCYRVGSVCWECDRVDHCCTVKLTNDNVQAS